MRSWKNKVRKFYFYNFNEQLKLFYSFNFRWTSAISGGGKFTKSWAINDKTYEILPVGSVYVVLSSEYKLLIYYVEIVLMKNFTLIDEFVLWF